MKSKSLIIVALSLVLVFGLALQATAEKFPIGTVGADVGDVVSTFESLITKVGGTSSPLNTVPGPYAQVDVFVYSSGQASIEFTALNSYFISDVIGVNLAKEDTAVESSIVFSTNTGNNTFDSQSNNEPANIHALFGDFNLNLEFTKNGFDGRFKDVSFLLSGGTVLNPITYTDAATILAFNSDGFDAYAHIFNVDGSITGFAAEVPIPAALPLFGTGLLGLGLLGWRRKSSFGK